MNAKIERTVLDVRMAQAVLWAMGEAMAKLYPTKEQIETLETLQELEDVLFEKLKDIEVGLEKLQLDNETAGVFGTAGKRTKQMQPCHRCRYML